MERPTRSSAHQADTELGPVGQRVVCENDAVRVWDIALQPGESQAWHFHEHPYLVIALQGAENRIDMRAGGEPRIVNEAVGGVVYREPGEVHMLTNVGTTPYHSRLVELLDKPVAAERSA